MTWDIELGRQISIGILIIMILVIIIRSRTIEGVNFIFFGGYLLFSLNDCFFYFYSKYTKEYSTGAYNICLMIVFLLYLYYYYRLLYLPVIKKIQGLILVLYFINLVLVLFLEKNILQHFSFIMFYVDILLLTFSVILFLYQTLNSDKVLYIKNYLAFWISVATMIFFIGCVPILFFGTNVSETVYFVILFLLNLINSGLILFGLIWNNAEPAKYG